MPIHRNHIDVQHAEAILGAAAFVTVHSYPEGRSVSIELSSYCDLTFAQLERFAEVYGTKAINVRYTASEGDLSDVTPGQSSLCYIIISEIPDGH